MGAEALWSEAAPDLLTRAQSGDTGALAEFYDDTIDGLLRWFERRTAAADVAADLTAETYAKMLSSLHRYDHTRGPGPSAWLYGIAKNEHKRWLRRRRVEQRARRRVRVEVVAPHQDELDLAELRADLETYGPRLTAGMASLSHGAREAVRLRVMEQHDYVVVAERLGCSVGAARVRVSRALTALWEFVEGGRS